MFPKITVLIFSVYEGDNDLCQAMHELSMSIRLYRSGSTDRVYINS
jgi:hypothetical protein